VENPVDNVENPVFMGFFPFLSPLSDNQKKHWQTCQK